MAVLVCAGSWRTISFPLTSDQNVVFPLSSRAWLANPTQARQGTITFSNLNFFLKKIIHPSLRGPQESNPSPPCEPHSYTHLYKIIEVTSVHPHPVCGPLPNLYQIQKIGQVKLLIFTHKYVKLDRVRNQLNFTTWANHCDRPPKKLRKKFNFFFFFPYYPLWEGLNSVRSQFHLTLLNPNSILIVGYKVIIFKGAVLYLAWAHFMDVDSNLMISYLNWSDLAVLYLHTLLWYILLGAWN